MILVDANLLLYSKFEDMPQHPLAGKWLEMQLNSAAKIGIPWQCLLAFLRIGTNPRVFARPMSIREAWEQATEWLSHPRVWIPEPTAEHAVVLGDLLARCNAGGNLVQDAHLAALAIEHGLTICTADADFARFPGVAWRNPLAASS